MGERAENSNLGRQMEHTIYVPVISARESIPQAALHIILDILQINVRLSLFNTLTVSVKDFYHFIFYVTLSNIP